MPRIFDNIEQPLLLVLQETLAISDHAEFLPSLTRRLKPGQEMDLTSISMQSPVEIEVRIDAAAVVAEVRRLLNY